MQQNKLKGLNHRYTISDRKKNITREPWTNRKMFMECYGEDLQNQRWRLIFLYFLFHQECQKFVIYQIVCFCEILGEFKHAYVGIRYVIDVNELSYQ